VTPTSIDQVIHAIQSSATLELTFSHGDEVRTIDVVPEGGKIGAMIAYQDLRINTGAQMEQYSLADASVM